MSDPALREDTTTPSFSRARPANVYMRLNRRSWGPDQRTPPARVARHRLPAPMLVPMLPPRIHAAPAHPARMSGPNTHVPARTARPLKQASLHPAAARARRWQQDHGQCTWHGIGRLSRRRHGDRMSGRGSPCGALFFVLSHFGADPLDFVTVSVCLCVFITAGPITKL
jgi:hypothetical protein